MPIPPPPLDELPVYPDPNDRTAFANRAFLWSKHLNVTFSPQLIALASNVKANADEAVAAIPAAAAQVALAAGQADEAAASAAAADASVAQAAASAAAAAVAAGAPKWGAGTYAEGATAYSPTTFQTYRRTAQLPGASAVDPALDRLRWAQLSVSPGELLIAALLLY